MLETLLVALGLIGVAYAVIFGAHLLLDQTEAEALEEDDVYMSERWKEDHRVD